MVMAALQLARDLIHLPLWYLMLVEIFMFQSLVVTSYGWLHKRRLLLRHRQHPLYLPVGPQATHPLLRYLALPL